MVDLSVIVVTWNAKRYVQECLESLSDQTIRERMEIIVVDNASIDGTAEMVREQFPRATLLVNAANLGFAKANNIGLRAATGRYLVLINSDVNVPPACLATMVTYMDEHTAVGVLGPQMLGIDGTVGRSYMRFPSLWGCFCQAFCLYRFLPHRLFGGTLMWDFKPTQTANVDVLNGWFLMVRREALQRVGLLDEAFFMYGEDIDWSFRFHLAGWSRVYLSDATALHYGGSSSSVAPTRFYIELQRANMRYWRKHHRLWAVIAYWLITLLEQTTRLCGHLVERLIGRERPPETSLKIERSAACIAWLMGRPRTGGNSI